MDTKIFKFTNTVDGDEDPIFIQAPSEADARFIFARQIGLMPSDMLKVEEVSEIPYGHDLF